MSSMEMLAEQVAKTESNDFWDNFIPIMQRSADLRHEPEFADFYLDPVQTLETSARHFPSFYRQMMQILDREKEPDTNKYDEYRIAVLDDMDTPQLRQQLRQRLDRYTKRLNRKRKRKHSRDAARLESALFIRVLLDKKADKLMDGEKPLPLGVYALVTTTYEDSVDRAMEEVPTARDIVGDDFYRMWCVRHHTEDMQTISTAMERIDVFAELEDLIAADPALALAWERQESALIEEFPEKILEMGLRISPGFFTLNEATLALDKLDRQYLSKPWSVSRYSSTQAFHNFSECIRETLREILTPQRIVEMSNELRSLGQYCLEPDNDSVRPMALYIQAAIRHLERVEPSQNQVAAAIYLMQSLHAAISDMDALSPHLQRLLKRMGKSRIARELSGESE